MKAFCDAQGLHYPDFLRWKAKLTKSKASSAEPKPAPNFIPVELTCQPAPTMSLHIGQHLRLELPLNCESKWLHQLMKLLMESQR